MKKLICMLVLVVVVFGTWSLFGQDFEIGDHEVFMMSTAEMLPAKTSYIENYELFLFNYTYGLSSRTSIGAFMIFPIDGEYVKSFTLSLKQQYLNTPKVKAAFWGSYTPAFKVATVGNVFSFGTKKTNYHLGLGAAIVSGTVEAIYMAGIRHRLSSRVSVMLEYTNFGNIEDTDFAGVLCLGFRFHMKNAAIDIGGFRPLSDIGGMVMFPILKFTIYLH